MYRLRLNTVKGPSSYGLCLPEKTLEGLGISANERYEVQVGQKLIRTSIGVAPTSRITAELKQKLRLPPGVLRLHIDRRGDRLVLGPFLGIMARPQQSSPYGEQTGFFRRLIARAKAMHIYAYVFGLDDANWKNMSVTGHRPYKTTTTWVTRVCPIPDVVFDRGFFKGSERRKAEKMKAHLAQEYGVHLFNEDVGNKWDVYQTLMNDPDLIEFLPETAKAESTDILADFINRHRVVYVKPANGNQGRHVFRVRQRRNRVSYEMHQRRGRIIRTSVPTMSAFMNELAATKERSAFLVQQGLNLTKVNGNAADVRALVQRDRHGKWHLTGAGVRIGGSGLVSNLHAGGNAAKIDVLLPRAERKVQMPLLKARINDLALRVAKTLSKQHLLGELGVDLGVGKDGRLWIIEVNLRPGRATFRRAGLTEAWRRSGVAPLEFSIYLWAHQGVETADDMEAAMALTAATLDDTQFSALSLDTTLAEAADQNSLVFGPDADTDDNAGADADTDDNAGTDADTDDNAGTDADTDDNAGADVDTDADAGTDADTDDDAGADVDGQAETAPQEEMNFTPATLGGYVPVLSRSLGSTDA